MNAIAAAKGLAFVLRELPLSELLVHAHEEDAVEAVRAATAGGADYSIQTTCSPDVLCQSIGTEVTLDVTTILTGGRVVRGILEGDSVPDIFLPRLIALWEQGRFPVDRLMTNYDFDAIEQAVRDSERLPRSRPSCG